MLWHSDFRRLWIGQSASQFAEQAGSVILPLIAVLTLHVDAGRLGVIRAVGQVPLLLVPLFAGAWVDGRSTRTVMVRADASRALVLGAVAMAGLLGLLGLPTLLAAAFAVTGLSVFFDVAYQACLVRELDRDLLVRANSVLEGSRSAAQLLGPAVGGALVSLASAPAAAAACAALFAVSFLSLRRIRRPESIPRRPADRATRIGRQIRDGVRVVMRDASLRAVALASAAFQISFAGTMTAYLLFLPRDLHLSGTTIGLVLAATGPGAVLGSFLAARLPARFGYGAAIVSAATVGDGLLLCVPALHGSSTTVVAALAAINVAFGLACQIVDVTIMSVRQAVTPHELQGRASATSTFIGMGLTPLGSLLGGFLAQEWGTRTSLLITAGCGLLSPATLALSPLARLGRALPRPGAPCAPEANFTPPLDVPSVDP